MREKVVRLKKGKSLFEFPENFTVVDIETTGLSAAGAEIIEISALRYRSGEKTAVFSSLLKPRYAIPYFITELTGITNAMVKDAPERTGVLSEFYDFVGRDVIVGHNVNFDVNFLYDEISSYLGKDLENDFVDVLRLSRYYLPFLPSHKQTAIAEYFSISSEGAHRAVRDTEICAENFFRLKRIAEERKNAADGLS